MKKIKLDEFYKNDVFEWVVMQRLSNFPNMPESGSFGDMEDVKFGNAKEYIDLVRNLEYSYPEFDFLKEASKYIDLVD